MARLLIRGLELAGHTVEVASTLRGYFRQPDAAALAAFEGAAQAEVQRLLTRWRAQDGVRPQMWFTYHPYYKALDLVGPSVAAELGIAYATAEASYAGKRDRDAWQAWQCHLAMALRLAEAHFCFTPGDAEGLQNVLGTPERLISLPPFTDAARFGTRPTLPSGATVRCVTLAMMRPGVKVESYLLLAATLKRLAGLDWRLTIIGDGPARATVAAAFANLPAGRIDWVGALPRDAVAAQLLAADLFLWPGIGEAYGMAYLEAQAAGLPVVALDSGGVASTLRAGDTGLLIAEGDLDGYVEAVRSLLVDAVLRQRMGRAARDFAHSERSLARAAAILDAGLVAACERHSLTSKGLEVG